MRQIDPRPYLGIPLVPGGREMTGADCWGLVRLVLGREAGIDLPAWETVPTDDATLIAMAAGVEIGETGWQPIAAADARALDVALISRRGQPRHVGIMVNSADLLHVDIEDGSSARVRPLGHYLSRGRLVGLYRHPHLAAAPNG